MASLTGSKLLLVFLAFNKASAIESGTRGCNLIIPDAVRQQPEPQPETGPLLLYVLLRVTQIRDIPHSGGSYGVDVGQVSYTF